MAKIKIRGDVLCLSDETCNGCEFKYIGEYGEINSFMFSKQELNKMIDELIEFKVKLDADSL